MLHRGYLVEDPDYKLWKKIQNYSKYLWEIAVINAYIVKEEMSHNNDLSLYLNKLEKKRADKIQSKQKYIINKGRS